MTAIYAEGIFWYLILLDAIVYNYYAWSNRHDRLTHWVSKYFPINKGVGIMYLAFVLWVGFALLRLDVIVFQ